MRRVILGLWLLAAQPAWASEPISYWEWLNRWEIWQLDSRISELEGAVSPEGQQPSVYSDLPALVDGFETERWGPNIVAHSETNAVDPLTHTNTIAGGGYYGRAQLIGNASVDPTYIPGGASIATISGGYNNVNNQIAGTIAGGAHHILYGAGDHGVVGGGSYNSIVSGSYSVIAGGGGAASPQSIAGSRSTIAGGGGNQIVGDHSAISGGFRNSVAAVGSSIAGGTDNTVNATYSLAAGRRTSVLSHAVASVAVGIDVESSSPGSINVSARGHAGQSIVFNLSNQTIGAQPAYLLGAGSWTTPRIPETAVWSGEFHITAVSDSGKVAAYKAIFAATAGRIISFNLEAGPVDEIGLAALSLTLSNRRLLLNVPGAASQTINWNATAVVSQVNL